MELFNVYARFDISPTHAEGVYVYDQQQKKYLDLYGGHGVISIGHGHPEYKQKLKDQIDQIGFYSNSVEMPIQQELAHKLSLVSGYPTYNLFLCNSGAEAVENAIKLASFHTNKKKVIAFKGSFHGRTAGALNITDNPNLSAPINQQNFPVEFLELNNFEQLDLAFADKDVCAVIVEGIQGVGGLDAPSIDFLEHIENRCKQNDALFILDEIQSGFGRSGKFFAHQYSNIKADIVTMAKGMGNGFPVAGILINPSIDSKYGMLGTTFGGNYLACAAAISVLEVIEKENLMQNVSKVNGYLQSELSKISSVKKIKGKGLMLGVEFDFPIKNLRENLLYDSQIITGSSSNPNLLRILPPLCITEQQIEPFISQLKKV